MVVALMVTALPPVAMKFFRQHPAHAPLAAWMRSKKTETVTGLRSRVSEGWKFKLTLPHRGRV
jgi:hypothetical protein